MRYYLYRSWPIYRMLVKHKLSKRCAICALNENCVTIHDSICEICRNERMSTTPAAELSHKPTAIQEQELDELLTQAQGKGRGLYDAIVLFSGGKDSTYILNRLKMCYQQLRLVALTVDNGFRSPIGKQNAEKVCEHLDIDHLEVRPYQIFKKLYKYGFENFSHFGFIATDVWEGELFQDIGRNLAAQMDIPLLVLGYTPEQATFLPKEFDEYHLYGSKEFKFKENQKFTRKKFLEVNLKDIFTPEEMNYWWDGSKWSNDKIPTLILPFQAWGYHKTEMVNEIVSLLHDILDDKSMNPMLTNDLYVILGLFLDYQIFGYSPRFELESARYVRTGKDEVKQNRNLWESAEYHFLKPKKSVLDSPDIQLCLTKLGLTKSALDDIIKKSKARLDGN